MRTTRYKDDRSYTNNVHDTIVVPRIYPLLKLKLKEIDAELAQLKDSDYAIDYHAENEAGGTVVIQERFRKPDNMRFNDFTFRYERNDHPEEIERKSEFYKIKGKINRFKEPFYFLYGIVDQEQTDLEKFALIDLRRFFREIKNKGLIRVDESVHNGKMSAIKDGILYAGFNENKDHSSSFISFDIALLHKVCPECILAQRGFYEGGIPKSPAASVATVNVRSMNATSKQLFRVRALARENGFRFINEDKIAKTEASNLIDFFQSTEVLSGNMASLSHKLMSDEVYPLIRMYLVPIPVSA